MEVLLIEKDADVEAMWPKASGWLLENLVGADVNLPTGVNLDREAVLRVLPTLGRLNFQMFMRSVDGGKAGALVINRRGFLFGRGQERTELTKVQAQVKEAEKVVSDYTATLTKAQTREQELKRRMAEGGQGGIDLADVKRQVEEWQEVIDFSYGPGVDTVTGQYLDSGTFVVTFLPVIMPGEPRGYPAGSRMVTTPVRFYVTEAGQVSSFGDVVKQTATFHPHIKPGGMCHGNMLDALRGPISLNNIPAAVDIMREWRISVASHDLDASWTQGAYNWWKYWWTAPRDQAIVRVDDPNHAWHFGGKWDGRTVQVSDKTKLFTTVEEFFGGSREDFLHVGERLVTLDYTRWPTQQLVKDYQAFKAKGDDGAPPCTWCRKATKGCPCHGATCMGCGRQPAQCTCPQTLDKPTVTTFVNNNITYFDVNFRADYRQRAQTTGYICDVDYGACRKNSKEHRIWRRMANRAPNYVCDEHLAQRAKETLAAEQKKAEADWKAEGKKAEGVVTA